MLKSGDAATPMRKKLSDMGLDGRLLNKITYLAGSADVVGLMPDIRAKEPFADDICAFLSDVSKALMDDKRSRQYPDVVTFAFWIRGASLSRLKERFSKDDGNIRLGRGVAFHIAPSNVPVNFAYSLAAGILAGNGNIVRVPSKGFGQVEIIADAFNAVLDRYGEMNSYIALVRYGHDKSINDLLSGIADTRIVWGGDATIAELRKSPLPPRSTEITFADRYSLAVIDSDAYMGIDDKGYVAEGFYNDTYLTDQNACTSPRIVVWTGSRREEAKKEFWGRLHEVVKEKYIFQDIQGVDKLTNGYLAAVGIDGLKIVGHGDNLIIRVQVAEASNRLMEFKGNSGYFFEYDCEDLMELRALCNDKRCQTIGLIGEKAGLLPLLKSGIKGVDRVVPIGKTMDFGLLWDGFDLVSQMCRIIKV